MRGSSERGPLAQPLALRHRASGTLVSVELGMSDADRPVSLRYDLARSGPAANSEVPARRLHEARVAPPIQNDRRHVALRAEPAVGELMGQLIEDRALVLGIRLREQRRPP